MQLFGTNFNSALMTNWKVSTEQDAAWSGWTELNANPPSPNVGAASEANVAFEIAAGSLSNGLLQVWTRAGTRAGGRVTGGQILQSVWQTTADPTKPWSSWQNPFVPQLVAPPGQPPGGNVVCFAAGQILDGRPQLYGATDDGILQTTFKTSATNPSSGWNGVWFPFQDNSPGLSVQDVTAARLADGSAQIWAWVNSPGSPTAEIWTSRQQGQSIVPTTGAIFGPWSSIGTVQERTLV
jgi:hypothetical protein